MFIFNGYLVSKIALNGLELFYKLIRNYSNRKIYNGMRKISYT